MKKVIRQKAIREKVIEKVDLCFTCEKKSPCGPRRARQEIKNGVIITTECSAYINKDVA